MTELKKASASERVIELLPSAIRNEILRLVSGRRGGFSQVREIRIRRDAACSLIIGRENVRLYNIINKEELDLLISRLIGGALYAHRDSIASGYISLEGGVRVGVCGYAAYEDNRLVGVSDMRSLVFRIPTGSCEFGDQLYSVFREGIGQGMLIYSPPGVGKTTALRSLAQSVGGGRDALRVCVVDERCEFSEEDYRGCQVDILKGYKRREGIEIATRTLSAELIMIDELGAEDCRSIIEVVRGGIPLIATAHASSLDEVMIKPSLRGLTELSVFSVFVGISVVDGEYRLQVDRI